jgi:transposase
MLDRVNPTIEELTRAVEQEGKKRPEGLKLMTHPGVGSIAALAFVLIMGTPERFKCCKQISSYVGLIRAEDSSAGHQRLGHICSYRKCRRARTPLKSAISKKKEIANRS